MPYTSTRLEFAAVGTNTVAFGAIKQQAESTPPISYFEHTPACPSFFMTA